MMVVMYFWHSWSSSEGDALAKTTIPKIAIIRSSFMFTNLLLIPNAVPIGFIGDSTT